MDSSSSTPSISPEPQGTVYSLSDETIADEVEFVEEIGNGNWGSVWLARPKHTKSATASEHAAFKAGGRKYAIKLVHRKKTAANASRIKSLWNEMKIIRALGDDKHPSIISFHSFVMTPSYAMITMTYLPTLVPVEVDESKCREWFHFLLSGVDFLHRRGVVHNDIKPANILLSHKNIPVLVDFGFAELKDPEDDTSFHSNLTYGTPEYLSPERARGITHDTRKSDVWSLGVTFFEILCGRTPFEAYDGDALQTKEDVERYWSRTLRGKWIGQWKLSVKMEKLLRRMMSPNADLRCTASQALADGYWKSNADSQIPRRSVSYDSSLVFEKDLDRLLNMTPPSNKLAVSHHGGAQSDLLSPPGLQQSTPEPASRHSHVRSRSQPKVVIPTANKAQPWRRVVDLSPIQGSPPASPACRSAATKENCGSGLNPNKTPTTKSRRAFGAALSPENNVSAAALSRIPVKRLDEMTSKRRSGLLGDLRRSNSNLAAAKEATAERPVTTSYMASNSVRNRVLEWEREKQRLRELERMEDEEMDQDVDEDNARKQAERQKTEDKLTLNREEKADIKHLEEVEKQVADNQEEDEGFMVVVKRAKEKKPDALSKGNKVPKPIRVHNKEKVNKENVALVPSARGSQPSNPPQSPPAAAMSPLSRMMNTLAAPDPETPTASTPPKQSKQNVFKHTIKSSIDKTLQFYKQSSLGRATNVPTMSRGVSFEIAQEAELTESPQSLVSPKASIRDASTTRQAATDAQMDRMEIWRKNVESVVQEARATFEATNPNREYEQPTLPMPPSQTRRVRSGRMKRQILAASQIFDESGAPSSMDSSFGSNAPPSSYSGPQSVQILNRDTPSLTASAETSPSASEFAIAEAAITSEYQRPTTSPSRSPSSPPLVEVAEGSNRSRGRAGLDQVRVVPLGKLDSGARRVQPSPKLSDVVDRNLFIAPSYTSRDNLLDQFNVNSSDDGEHFSICHVEPYPKTPRASADLGRARTYLDTPDRINMEHIYDRFIMTTGNVKRAGRGYQSDALAPPAPTKSGLKMTPGKENKKPVGSRAFYTARKQMPPPVSSDDLHRRSVSVDELGFVYQSQVSGEESYAKRDDILKGSIVRRAFKAMVPGKSAAVSRHASRLYPGNSPWR